MARNIEPPGLGDYVVIALNPLLIMALVGSLVFFLAEVLYVGQYHDSLLWVLFFFVFGTVLIARISMSAGISERAALYGSVLGLLVWLALQRFVADAWALNLLLIAAVWWSAHRLTWDCTLIDESVDASGVGLLQEAGLDAAPPTQPETAPSAKQRKRKDESALAGWWRRYLDYREQRRHQPHTPGVWVIYFSLAALPLYGLGQSLIPAHDAARRRYAFWLMSIYVGSGLGLLLTTSFLGLRRYLRQRKLKMPPAMAGAWMLFGALMILALLSAGTFLPRPTPEYALVRLPWQRDSDEVEAARRAVRDGKSGKGEGQRSGRGHEQQSPDTKDDASSSSSAKQENHGDKASDKQADGSGKAPGKGEDKHAESSSDGSSQQQQKSGSQLMPEVGSNWMEGLGPLLKKAVLFVFVLVIAVMVVRGILSFLANFTTWARDLLKMWEALWRRLQQLAPEGKPDEESEDMLMPPRQFSGFDDPFTTGRASTMTAQQLISYSFAALEAWSRERELGRDSGETPLEFAGRLSEALPPLEAGVTQLAALYVAIAYGGLQSVPPGSHDILRELWRLLQASGRPQLAGNGRRSPPG